VKQNKRPSTLKGYRDVWEDHLKALCERNWLKEVRTYTVQSWLNEIGKEGLSRNSLRHVKSIVSGIFTLAKQQDYFEGERTHPAKQESILGLLSLKKRMPTRWRKCRSYFRCCQNLLQRLSLWLHSWGCVTARFKGCCGRTITTARCTWSRSIWNGHVTAPKTRKGCAPVPVIRQLAERLEMHRLRSGNPQTGPIFANSLEKPLSMNNLLKRAILPALDRCEQCRKPKAQHGKADHQFKRDARYPELHGWHAARLGLGSNLYRLGVPEIVIQRILRHTNVSTTASYYIKSAADDVRNAMEKLEQHIPSVSEAPKMLRDSERTLNLDSYVVPATLN
jgi:hypothetical protein